VLADAAAQGAEKIAILGDTIDYGPNPLECLARRRPTSGSSGITRKKRSRRARSKRKTAAKLAALPIPDEEKRELVERLEKGI